MDNSNQKQITLQHLNSVLNEVYDPVKYTVVRPASIKYIDLYCKIDDEQTLLDELKTTFNVVEFTYYRAAYNNYKMIRVVTSDIKDVEFFVNHPLIQEIAVDINDPLVISHFYWRGQ